MKSLTFLIFVSLAFVGCGGGGGGGVSSTPVPVLKTVNLQKGEAVPIPAELSGGTLSVSKSSMLTLENGNLLVLRPNSDLFTHVKDGVTDTSVQVNVYDQARTNFYLYESVYEKYTVDTDKVFSVASVQSGETSSGYFYFKNPTTEALTVEIYPTNGINPYVGGVVGPVKIYTGTISLGATVSSYPIEFSGSPSYLVVRIRNNSGILYEWVLNVTEYATPEGVPSLMPQFVRE
jgi:hypothetical protein